MAAGIWKILNVLEHHATKECPLTITEITNFVNQEFAAFQRIIKIILY